MDKDIYIQFSKVLCFAASGKDDHIGNDRKIMVAFYKYVFLDQRVFFVSFCNSKPLFLIISVFAIATNLICGVYFSQMIKQEHKIALDPSTEF